MTSIDSVTSNAAPTPSIRVLIAEDEANLGTILEQFLTSRGLAVTIVRNGRLALEKLQQESFDVALLDIVMPEMDGLEVLRRLRDAAFPPEIIIITGNSSIDTALAAMKLGAYDFLSKPYRMAEIEALVRRAWEKRLLRRANVALEARLQRAEPSAVMDTQFAPLRATLSLVERVARADLPVLITGPAGTGKSTMARHIHAHSTRASAPFVVMDCRATPEAHRDMLTGSGNVNASALLTLAHGGTLFLEQVQHLSSDAQDIVAQVLAKSGANERARVREDVRIMASSTLTETELAPHLRDELLQMLTVTTVQLPSLADRRVDIPLLAERIVAQLSSTPVRIAPQALAVLERAEWPGNIRELRTVLERALWRATGSDTNRVIEPDHLGDAGGASTLRLDDLERRQIAHVLELTAWHQGRAAELLGISPKTLYRKIREYGFARPTSRSS